MMVICPDCQAPMPAPDSLFCAACGWQGLEREGVEVRLRRNHLENEAVARYFANYDEIAALDLTTPIQELRYVENSAKKMIRMVGDVRGKAVCDLGCGRGTLTGLLRGQEPASITAIDISGAYLKRLVGVPGVRPVLADAENLPFSHAFDVVVSTDVMEHVLNVGSFLYCLNRALKPGGRAYIRVPYRENLLAYSPHLGCKHQFVHLRTYNRRLLKDALRDAGFKVTSMRLGGEFVGRPYAFWVRKLPNAVYRAYVGSVERHLGHAADAMMLPTILTLPFMPPISVVVAARKSAEIRFMGSSGIQLQRFR